MKRISQISKETERCKRDNVWKSALADRLDLQWTSEQLSRAEADNAPRFEIPKLPPLQKLK